jgi:hypothetical protein
LNIDPKKVEDAIAVLNAAAEAMLSDKSHVLIAAQCVQCAAALRASLQIAGLESLRTIQTTGVPQ